MLSCWTAFMLLSIRRQQHFHHVSASNYMEKVQLLDTPYSMCLELTEGCQIDKIATKSPRLIFSIYFNFSFHQITCGQAFLKGLYPGFVIIAYYRHNF